MPYDPNFPASHEELTSPAFRAQFNALNDKIDAIPAGPPGPQGPQGNNGNDGQPGPQGEVTILQLNAAIADALAAAAANSSAKSNAVATLDTPFANDPPTVADMEVLRGKLNELILALRR